MYSVVDLFAGAGGLSLGFTQTKRFYIAAAAENNAYARKTYKRNHPKTRLYSDVRDIDYSEIKESFGDIDVVIGGPPCQGFSNANRQRSTIVSMNNRLVKEYVRAICELRPKAFVMENVAMLRSNLHRFIVDEDDLSNQQVMELEMQTDKIELLPASAKFPEALEFSKEINNIAVFAWTPQFFKVINLLYKNRINHDKFTSSIEKHKDFLLPKLKTIQNLEDIDAPSLIKALDSNMAAALINYIEESKGTIDSIIKAMEKPIILQKMLSKMKEISDNKIHVYDYKNEKGAVIAVVHSYAVLDYVKGILEKEPYNYRIYPNLLNALDYGAPQKRERFIAIGLSQDIDDSYVPPAVSKSGKYNTVYDAISDLENIPASVDNNSNSIELEPYDNLSELGTSLRGKLLYNHVTTETTEIALERFKALKEGENFHDLDTSLKGTYSNADRTQNTIYMRLKYKEPSGTVVNVRKSMWIHPTLDRAISIREAARLQTFPDTFVFEGSKDSQYQQIGNAVPPFLSRAVARSLLPILNKNAKK